MAEWPNELRARVEGFSARQRLQASLAARWLALDAADAEALAAIAEELRLGENHLRDFLDWTEEIAVRDGASIAAILGGEAIRQALGRDLGRNDGVKAVREALRRRRYPRLVQAEEDLRRQVRELRLPPNVRLVLPPDLRDGELRLEIRATDAEVLRGTLEGLGRLDFSGLFASLNGRRG